MSDMNLNNLELDDNTFEVLPEGDYKFTVESHELGYASSEKMPANTQQITVYLDIPYMSEGEVKHATIKKNLFVWKKTLWVIRQFGECIGMMPEKGKAQFNHELMDGRTGVCQLTVGESRNGNEFNNVELFYAPSKAPMNTANDEAWAKKDAFREVKDDDGLPFLE